METKNVNLRRVLGIIIVVSAIGIMILKYFTFKSYDDFIMPIILVGMGIMFTFMKPEEEKKQIVLSRRKQFILVSTLSIVVVAGIITAFIVH